MDVQSAKPFRTALISMPWPLFNRPSIQLGSLKAYLARQEGDRLQIDLFHPYLAVARRLGPELYHWISRNMWACEALYAPLLFPERLASAKKMVRELLRREENPPHFDFDGITRALREHLDGWLSGRDWRNYQLIGFSVCFNQLFSSLVAARQLKKLAPTVPVVFGGSFCAPETAAGLLRSFSQIDWIISGEGEQPLRDLCRFLEGKRDCLPPAVMGKVRSLPSGFATQQLSSLEELPIPDYRDYFAEMQAEFASQTFIPVLPIEFSRGCWWGKCAFCNLHLQWCGYRAKKAERMEEEVLALAESFGSLDYAFTDNALPPREALSLFTGLANRQRDYRFFGEIRVQHRPQEIAIFARGGLRTVQAGIESLSTSLLRRMRKGVRAIDNVAAMKNALASDMLLEGNLITEFPGSDDHEAEETLRNLDYVFPFHPLTTASFFLGLGSPVDQEPAFFGIRAVVRHSRFAKLFPPELLSGQALLVKEYRGDRRVQRKRWEPVVRKIKQWQQYHRRRGKSLCKQPLLSFREGGTFLLIRQELPDGPPLHHRLRGASRGIYLFCDCIRELAEIRQHFPALGQDQLRGFLEELTAKRLMFREGEQYLSLAIREP